MKDWGNPNNYNENQDSQSGSCGSSGSRPVKWWETALGILISVTVVGWVIWCFMK